MSSPSDYASNFFSSSIRNLLSESINNIPRNVESNKINIDFINQENKKIIIYAEIPGVDRKKINLDFYNNLLTISVEREFNDRNSGSTIYISEIKYGKFERKINLPICVTKKETVSVEYVDGILKITINLLIEEENRFNLTLS
jgi:HSP20 family protein